MRAYSASSVQHLTPNQATEAIQKVVLGLLEHLCLPFSRVEVMPYYGAYRANILSERAAFIIGTHGERLDALQYVTKTLLWKELQNTDIFVILDVDNYKYERDQKFFQMALQRSQSAIETGVPQPLPPMESALRRLVHLYLLEEGPEGIRTESQGEGEDRHIVLHRT